MSANIMNEKRAPSDRRSVPTCFWDVFRWRGRRRRNRRVSEHERSYFVDGFSLAAFLLVLLLLTFTLADGLITVYLFDAGRCEEVNPLMAWLLHQGQVPFFVGKYALTAAGLPLLLVYQNWYLFGTRIRVGHVLPTFVVLYAGLLVYQCYLLSLP